MTEGVVAATSRPFLYFQEIGGRAREYLADRVTDGPSGYVHARVAKLAGFTGTSLRIVMKGDPQVGLCRLLTGNQRAGSGRAAGHAGIQAVGCCSEARPGCVPRPQLVGPLNTSDDSHGAPAVQRVPLRLNGMTTNNPMHRGAAGDCDLSTLHCLMKLRPRLYAL